MSIPVVKLQNYSSSYPVHCTEDDIRENLELEEKAIQLKLESLKLKKQDVLTTLSKCNLQSQLGIESAARGLNDLLFPLIFTGEDADYKCACQKCHNRCCNGKKAGKCNINKGYKTVAERAIHISTWIRLRPNARDHCGRSRPRQPTVHLYLQSLRVSGGYIRQTAAE